MNAPVEKYVEQHAESVYRFALRLSGNHHAAEDLTQETFLRAWRHRRRLGEVRDLRIWLLTITANLWRDRLRRGRYLVARAGPLPDDAPGAAIDVERWSGERDDVDRVLGAMERLPPRQREVLHLVACEQMSPSEAAQVLAMTTDAAKASLSLARKKMREWLADVYHGKES